MSPTEYVWVLPRVLLPRQQSDPVVFHPYVQGAVKTGCGERTTRWGGARRMTVADRRQVERIAAPCGRCYR